MKLEDDGSILFTMPPDLFVGPPRPVIITILSGPHELSEEARAWWDARFDEIEP